MNIRVSKISSHGGKFFTGEIMLPEITPQPYQFAIRATMPLRELEEGGALHRAIHDDTIGLQIGPYGGMRIDQNRNERKLWLALLVPICIGHEAHQRARTGLDGPHEEGDTEIPISDTSYQLTVEDRDEFLAVAACAVV